MASKTRRIGLIGGAVLLVVIAGAVVGGSLYGAKQLETRLERIAQVAELKLSHDGVSVSPLGTATLTGLVFSRADGKPVVSFDRAVGELSPMRALAGSRRPERLTVEGLKVQMRVVDGRPAELLQLAKAAKQVLRPKRGNKPANTAKKRKSGTAIAVAGGEISVTVRGKGAQFLPKGLKLSAMQIDIDTAGGKGVVTGTLSGSTSAKLSAKLIPASGDQPAKVAARFAPEMRLALPKMKGLPALALTVAGFGYDSVDGPRVEGVALRHGQEALVQIARVAPWQAAAPEVSAGQQPSAIQPDDQAKAPSDGQGVRLGPVKVMLPHATALQVMAALTKHSRKKTAKGGQDKPASPTPGESRDAGRAKGAPQMWPPSAAKWTANLASLTIIMASGGRVELRADGLNAPLPADMGAVSAKRLTLIANRTDKRLSQVLVDGPALDVRWRESGLRTLPGGRGLYWGVERLRGNGDQPADPDQDAETEGSDETVDGAAKKKSSAKADKAKKAKKKRRRRRRGKRIPATKAAEAPLRKLHRRLLGIDGGFKRAFAKLARLVPFEIKITGGRIGLLPPAATKPTAGLRAGTVHLSPALSDGSRSLQLSVEPFVDAESWGTVNVDVQAGSAGELSHATLALGGGGWARALSTLGKAASVQKDANLKLDLKLTTTGAKELLLAGTLRVDHVGVNWWRIAPRPIDDFSFGGKMKLVVADKKLKPPPEPKPEKPRKSRKKARKKKKKKRKKKFNTDGRQMQLLLTDVDVGGAKLNITFEVLKLRTRPTVHLRIEAPEQDCKKVGEAIPASLVPTIGKIAAEGEISGNFDLTIPLGNPYKGKLKAHLNDENCTVTQFGELDVEALAKPFKRPVNENGTILEDQLIGPRSEAWVPLEKLPPWVPYAMISTEDAAFYHHKGVRLGLTSRAIKMCLDYGRFVYGGSTITQQLVKNIFLTREKYLGRKFEELLIVWHMERNLISAEKLAQAEDDAQPIKDRILELYINGIEFSPNLYGIQRGAKLYFDKDASELTPLESAFLAANKPCPKCGHKRFEQKKWTAWWQERMVGIMNKMRINNIITEEQFTAEAPYVPKFVGWPQASAPGPDGGGDVGGEEE